MDTNAANRCERAAPKVGWYQGAHVMSSRQNDRQTCTNISQHQQRGAKNPVGDIGGGQIDQWQENARAPRSPPYKECHLATTIDKKAVRFQGRSFGQHSAAARDASSNRRRRMTHFLDRAGGGGGTSRTVETFVFVPNFGM